MEEINFKSIEEKWQKRWEKQKLFETKIDKKKKFYVLEMFPYPSGDGLHMGHALNYVIGDVYARFKKMQGYNVLHPMGYDALGLPAENAAIKAGTHPEDYTNNSIKNYIRQQKSLGISYDWTRLVNTANPDYYKWDQWIFLKMFEHNLAYQKEALVNWCPECKTVLANEQVQNGKCWRHEETDVEIKKLKQWFLKITNYADELYESIDTLKDWPEKTKAMQKNWIGKSHGTEIDFEINKKIWPVFTTRPDTIFGVTFMVIAATHPKLMEIVTKEQKSEVQEFLSRVKTVSQKSMKDVDELNKEGIFTGAYAVNPINGERVPVYAGNFVVADYGSGMVMAVPAHDQRDFLFAKKYNIPIKQVIEGEITQERAYTDDGLLINSGEFNGMNNREAINKINEKLEREKKGRKVVNFRLRDWGISRQRYWGTPIPIIHCQNCGIVPVPEKELPVKLPKEIQFGEGNPLLTNEEWLNVKCPKCNANAKRESDTMDTFVNSSWYFLRYTDNKNNKEIFDKEKAKYWCPIDQYIGGAEHACMHLIYFRFYTKFLADIGLIDFREPAKKLFHQGMLHGEGGIKMSKSKGNVINPEIVSKTYGIDTARYFLLSLAEPDKPRDWSEKGISGSLKFIKKIFKTIEKIKIKESTKEFESKLNKTIKEITDYIETFRYRMATIKLKELFEEIEKQESISQESLKASLKLLSPFCPHITEELWNKIGEKEFISQETWPEYQEEKIKSKDNLIDLNKKIIQELKPILLKFPEKKEIHIYAMPFEIKKINIEQIIKETKKDIKIWQVNDKKKYDPQNKAKKAKPGLPSFYIE
jgi:leucyl-tRNA synthetase